MKLFRVSLFLCLLLGAVAYGDDAPPAEATVPKTPATGELSGRVALPEPSTGPLPSQPYELVIEPDVVRTNPPLAVVYLEGDFPPAERPAVARVIQRDLAFIPALLPVRTGTRVEFPNEDPTYHNVFSFSPARRFDLGRYRSDEAEVPAQVFDRAGLVALRCDIHPHMRAAILVLDTPHFTVTAADGTYRLSGLPPGRHVLKAWIDSRTTLSRVVEISAGRTLHADLP
ncbi:MAG: hypothetical protein H7067_14690 [Burkholderiales bacterium]|nr:hypothetical protein [Opitutaceae bacterium]